MLLRTLISFGFFYCRMSLHGLIDDASGGREAEGGSDEARRTIAEAAVERDAVNAWLLRADRAVLLRVQGELRGKYTHDAEVAFGSGGVAVFLAKLAAHLGGERVVVGAGEVGDLDLRRIGEAARAARGDDGNLVALAVIDDRGLQLDAVDGVDHVIVAARLR